MKWDRMSALIGAHGKVVRVMVAETQGSAPREAGAGMLMWDSGQAGTIGGGQLEWEATQTGRQKLAGPRGAWMTTHALGPDLGQCCGGRVRLVTEVLTKDDLPPKDAITRSVHIAGAASVTTYPAAATPLANAARARVGLEDGFLVEPLPAPGAALWIWGAGHVGRAIAGVLAPLEQFNLTLVDTHADRMPAFAPEIAAAVETVIAAEPVTLVPFAPRGAHHLILTYSHDLDLALCDALLRHGFDSAGLIGSATKWARFRKRLSGFGHADAAIARIMCPIGDPSLGKHPQAIAVSVATRLLTDSARQDARGTT